MRSLTRASESSILAVLALCLVAACFKDSDRSTVAMTRSPQNPAADGSVATDHDDNGNTRVTVEVKHLAPPDRVASGATVYVVWAQPFDPQGPAQNLGALQVSDDLRGTLHAVTAMRAFDLIVTAEPSPAATQPSSASLLSARVSPGNR